jgi:phage terminase large subunit-like protein
MSRAPAMGDRWRADPAAFIEQCLVISTEDGRPFRLLDVERAFIKQMFLFDTDGRLLHPELIYAAIKKSGKTTFAAVLVIVTLLLFGGRRAEAYCVANDLEQAQGRVFELCRRIVEDSPLLRGQAKVSADRIVFAGSGSTITALASDYASAAGSHPTIAVFDELWGYISERARRLWDELVPVPTRKISCRLVVSHAGFEGESELLHELYQRGVALPVIGPDLHAGDGMLMFWTHRPVGPWQDEKWFTLMRRSLRSNQYLRMVENRFVTTESSFVDLAWWDACTDAAAVPVVSNTSLPVWVGLDASTKRDSTAIVAVTWDAPTNKAQLVFHRVFQPSPDEPLDFEATVERTVHELRRRFAVRGVWYDPYQMAAVAQRLQAAGAPMREFPQTTGNLTAMGSNLYELVKGRGLVVYPDPALRLAVSRAIAVETSRGWRITKEKSAHKIDVVVALAMAAHAAVHLRGDEAVPIVGPLMIDAAGNIVRPSGAPVQRDYQEGSDSTWRSFVGSDGSISMTPRTGGWPWS